MFHVLTERGRLNRSAPIPSETCLDLAKFGLGCQVSNKSRKRPGFGYFFTEAVSIWVGLTGVGSVWLA